jgi:UDP-N-acetylglucosamine--N-acetylmuramyl-(pentapeptide) pyrophosphoryl-undecaprenol N-acetylglucosamine transferase
VGRRKPLVLLVASTGGHLAQLYKLRSRLADINGHDVLWVTFPAAQSRSLLAGEDVAWADFTAPRDLRHVLSNVPLARGVVRENDVDLMVSTGSGIALSFLPLARAHGVSAHYIESAARCTGPSMTGRILHRVPRLRTYTQYPGWASDGWQYRGSVFDGFDSVERPDAGTPKRVLVTLGTIPYGFPRLVRRLAEIIPPGVEVLWQTGSTDCTGLGIQSRGELPIDDLRDFMSDSDVVVAHAGIGSALGALESGLLPVLVPRQAEHGEHVDDHQRLIAAELDRRGLALHRTVETLTWADLCAAGSRGVVENAAPPEIRLDV